MGTVAKHHASSTLIGHAFETHIMVNMECINEEEKSQRKQTLKKSGWDKKWLNPNKGSIGQNRMRNERLLDHAGACYDEHEMTVQTDTHSAEYVSARQRLFLASPLLLKSIFPRSPKPSQIFPGTSAAME